MVVAGGHRYRIIHAGRSPTSRSTARTCKRRSTAATVQWRLPAARPLAERPISRRLDVGLRRLAVCERSRHVRRLEGRLPLARRGGRHLHVARRCRISMHCSTLPTLIALGGPQGDPQVFDQFDYSAGGRVFFTSEIPHRAGYQIQAGWEGIPEWNPSIVYPKITPYPGITASSDHAYVIPANSAPCSTRRA